MRAIAKPVEIFQDVFDQCIAGVGSYELRVRYEEIFTNLSAGSDLYDLLAIQAELWTIPLNNQANDDLVVGQVTKKELKNLYSSYMAVQGKPARAIYDRLLASAPGERCPYCGVGRVATLDHYLPKAKFPELSVVAANLVPACRDCNLGGKGVAVASDAENQPIHPYYEADKFNGSQWLFCQIHPTSPATIQFYSNPPDIWTETTKRRTFAHLKAFDLSARFSVEAAEELAFIRQIFIDYYDGQSVEIRRKYLLDKEAAEQKLHTNSWKRAMYQALGCSDWFCNGGFR